MLWTGERGRSDKIDELLKPEGYLGLAREEVNAVIAHVEALRRTDPLK